MAKQYAYGGGQLTLSIRDQSGLIKNFHKISKEMDEGLKRELVQIAEDMLEDAKEHTPVKTGALRDALQLYWHKSGYVFEMGWDEQKLRTDPRNKGGRWYAPYVELGTGNGPARYILTDAFRRANPGRQFKEVLDYIIAKSSR